MSTAAASVFDLSPAEKLQLVEDLWDDIAADPASVPVHPWQVEEIERRLQNFKDNPGSALTWDEVKQRVWSRH